MPPRSGLRHLSPQLLGVLISDNAYQLYLCLHPGPGPPPEHNPIQGWVVLAVEVSFLSIQDLSAPELPEKWDRHFVGLFQLLPLLTLVQTPKDVPRFTALAASCLTCDTWEQLEEIRCPVMVIGGKQDKLVTAEASVEMAQKLGCSLYLYEFLGHAAYEEAAKDFNRRVYDFFIS